MDKNTLVHEHTKLLQAAHSCTSRQEALECIHRADKIQQAINAIDHPERWCGGVGGWDNYVERWH